MLLVEDDGNVAIPPTGTRAPPSEMATHLQQQTRNRRK